MNKQHLYRIIKKAHQSDGRQHVSAIALNRKGDIIGTSVNKCRINKSKQSLHAEIDLIRKHGSKIRTIIIARVNRSGDLMPISACCNCEKMADRFGISIRSIL